MSFNSKKKKKKKSMLQRSGGQVKHQQLGGQAAVPREASLCGKVSDPHLLA